jgi:hypothetical protein
MPDRPKGAGHIQLGGASFQGSKRRIEGALFPAPGAVPDPHMQMPGEAIADQVAKQAPGIRIRQQAVHGMECAHPGEQGFGEGRVSGGIEVAATIDPGQ